MTLIGSLAIFPFFFPLERIHYSSSRIVAFIDGICSTRVAPSGTPTPITEQTAGLPFPPLHA